MDEDTVTALRAMVDLAGTFPGQFRPGFELGCRAGVAEGAERWHVRFEGDISDNPRSTGPCPAMRTH